MGFSGSDTSGVTPQQGRRLAHLIVKLVVITGLVALIYLVGLLRHSPGAYTQLKQGGTAAYPGLIKQASAKSISIKTDTGTKTVALKSDTPYALFPKNYQTLIPIGLPASAADIVVGATEASVSVQLPYLKKPQALRVNLVRDDVLSGKVIEVTADSIKFKAYAASEYTEQTLKVAANAPVEKLGTDGKLTQSKLADVKVDQGMYAYLNKAAGPDDAVIQRLIVADFSSTN